jgi:hypothetical protein
VASCKQSRVCWSTAGEQQNVSYGAAFFRTPKRIANVNPSKFWQQKAYVKDLAMAKDIMGNARDCNEGCANVIIHTRNLVGFSLMLKLCIFLQAPAIISAASIQNPAVFWII